MKMSDMNTKENLKVLVYGNSGAGKTVFSCSFPGPTLLLDFDGKADSAASFYADDRERLEQIDVRDLSARMQEDPIEEFKKIIREELIPNQSNGKFPYRTLILDSLTTFSYLTLKHIVRVNKGIKAVQTSAGSQPGLQHYGILRREFNELIPGLLSLPCNVVMLGHIDTKKDELTGELVRGPLMDGAFAQQLPIYFKEVYRAFVEKDKHLLQTKSDYKFSCRTQIKGLPSQIEAEYQNLIK